MMLQLPTTFLEEFTAPQNYGGKSDFGGQMSLTQSLIQSRNIPAVKLGKAVGLKKVIETARVMGIESPMQPVISLPLGSIGVTPLEMASAFATFARQWVGSRKLRSSYRLQTAKEIFCLDNTPKPRQVLDPWATASLTTMLKGVLEPGGTGQKANIGRPAAGQNRNHIFRT